MGTSGGPPDSTSPTRDQISHAIALSAGYLERACGPDGKFVYEVDINSGKKSHSYNIVRHAGAIYALAMLNRAHPDPQAVNAMVRAAAFLRQNYVGPGVRPGHLAVWSEPLAEQSKSQQHDAELGATGLGLVALAEVRRAEPKEVSLEELQSLGRFLLFLQKDDGSFVNKYRAESGPVQDWESLYYPGEAALGFISLYEADHSREWLNVAGKALSFLAKSRAGHSIVPADHWALIATAKLLPYCDQSSCPGSSCEQLIQHAIQICNSILRDQFRGSAAVGIAGAFDPDGGPRQPLPALRGCSPPWSFCRKMKCATKIEAAAGRGIAFLLRMQVGSGPYSGGMPGAFATRVLDSSEIRIDYVQHALCAWLGTRIYCRVGRNRMACGSNERNDGESSRDRGTYRRLILPQQSRTRSDHRPPFAKSTRRRRCPGRRRTTSRKAREVGAPFFSSAKPLDSCPRYPWAPEKVATRLSGARGFSRLARLCSSAPTWSVPMRSNPREAAPQIAHATPSPHPRMPPLTTHGCRNSQCPQLGSSAVPNVVTKVFCACWTLFVSCCAAQGGGGADGRLQLFGEVPTYRPTRIRSSCITSSPTLSDHFKSGQQLSLQNRPTGLAVQD